MTFTLPLLLSCCVLTLAWEYTPQEQEDRATRVTWCTINASEQKKCENFAAAIERDRGQFDRYDYMSLNCTQAFDKEECMSWIDQEKVDLTTLDAGEVFLAGRFHSLVPIMKEKYKGGFEYYYSVAVVRKNGLKGVNTLSDLRGRKACFAGVGSMAGWVLPVYTLMKRRVMEVVDCNNHVKSATNFFGPSCAVNALLDKNNPIGDNSDKLCQLCIGKIPGGKCTRADPYADFQGAFKCLLEVGEIAFLKHTTVDEMISLGNVFKNESRNNFQLLCTDGQRRPLEQYRTCNWGSVPSHAIVTSSAKSSELRNKYQSFLRRAIDLYSSKNANSFVYNTTNQNQNDYRFNDERYGREQDPNNFNRNNPYDNRNQNAFNRNDLPRNPYDEYKNQDYDPNLDRYGSSTTTRYQNEDEFYNRNRGYNTTGERPVFYEQFNIFESALAYGGRYNLLFQDNTENVVPIPEPQQNYEMYLGDSIKFIFGIRDCPVNHMTLCVTSDVEQEKCVRMRTALKSQLLKPEMNCYKAHSHIHCMQAIKSGQADVAVLDASDVYTGGLNYDLIPFISEIYNLGLPEYYVVAVAKEEDPSTELTYLKGKYTCHTGINLAAGWVYPMAYLISNGWIRSYKCNSMRAAAEYFTKSCVPGAISTEYNTDVPYDNMCDLCHGASFRYCRRDASEDYYGYTGAFRCLVEGGGDVAFVKHTTVMENTGGKRREWWARDALAFDFELLCPDGTRAEVNEYERCNLGKVKSNAVVTRGGYYGYNETEINAYINLFVYAQQFYGKKETDEFSFSMFYSHPPYSDLIFQDATQQLVVIPPVKRHYAEYLGSDFLRARRIVDCHAGAGSFRSISIFGIVLAVLSMLSK